MTDEKVKDTKDAGEKSKKDDSPVEKVLKDMNTSHEIEDKTEEVKKIEHNSEVLIELDDETPCLQLEYFSKEDLCEKIDQLDKALAEREKSLKTIQDEKEKLKSKIMHLQAEFENAQKRWDKSRQELRIQNIASVLKNFLPLYDSFKKAISSKTEVNKKEIEVLTQFFNQFLNIYKSYQAEHIEVKKGDIFDYAIHEALTSIEKEDVPENSILDIIQEGWKLGKEVLRYTKVVIAKKPKPPEPEPKAPTEEKEKETEEVDDEKINNEEK